MFLTGIHLRCNTPSSSERNLASDLHVLAPITPTNSHPWPGVPANTYNMTGEPVKLMRIGDGGPVAGAKEYFLEHLDEFISVYKNRPDKTNTCGIRLSHALAVYTIAKRLQPSTIVESGINSGQSTYFFRQACPQARIISIDPEVKPICGQPVRWIDDTNNEYLTGDTFVDFDQINWRERISKGELDPSDTLVFIDDHRGFFKRFPVFVRHGFRHLINEDNYKMGEGATRFDKAGLTPKQLFRTPHSLNAQWLFHNLRIYAEFPPLLTPTVPKDTSFPKKIQGGFLHPTDDLQELEEPLLRPDVFPATDGAIVHRLATALGLDEQVRTDVSYQEFHGYCYLAYMELVPLSPLLQKELRIQ